MQKKVNVRSSVPIVDIAFPLVGNVKGIHLSTKDILTCLRNRAKVEEVIGTTIILLDFANYDKDNSVELEYTEAEVDIVLDCVPAGEPLDSRINTEAEVKEVVITDETLVVTDTVKGEDVVKEDIKYQGKNKINR